MEITEVEIVTLNGAADCLQQCEDSEEEEILTTDDVNTVNSTADTSPMVSDYSFKLKPADEEILLTVHKINEIEKTVSMAMVQVSQPLDFGTEGEIVQELQFEKIPFVIPQSLAVKSRVEPDEDVNLNGKDRESAGSFRNDKKKPKFKNLKNKRTFICPYCSRGFQFIGRLTSHIRTHTGEKPFGCADCPRRFAEKTSLIYHVRIHLGVKPYVCMTCQNQYSRQYHLNRHSIRCHSNKKPFACSYCKYKSTTVENFTVHLRKHTKEKPYVCKFCKRRFSSTVLLNRHIKRHIKDRPYACSICGCKYRLKNALKHHLQLHAIEKTNQ